MESDRESSQMSHVHEHRWAQVGTARAGLHARGRGGLAPSTAPGSMPTNAWHTRVLASVFPRAGGLNRF